MNRTKSSTTRVRLVLCGAFAVGLSGCTTYVEQPSRREVYVPPPRVEPPPRVVYTPPPPQVEPPPVVYAPPPQEAPVVVIQIEDDFIEPLSPYGSWVVVGAHGRCWRPARVEAGWRPYSKGYWRHTDAGWYWVSDEPWGWATYHYGRWDLTPEDGWVWVPHRQWAPAWVSWRQGGGYVGWAPLPPSARFEVGGAVAHEPAFAPRAFVFVEERRLLEPVRPTTVVVNNTTIINQTVNITKIQVVNKTVVNEGPRPEAIQRVSGRKVEAVAINELRRKEETEVVTRQPNIPSSIGKKGPPPRRAESDIRTVGSRQIESPPEVTKAPPPAAPRPEVRPPAEPAPVAKPVLPEPDKDVRSPRQRQVENEKGKAKGRPDAPPAKAVLPPDSGQVQKPVQPTEVPPPAANTDVSRPARQLPVAKPASPDEDNVVRSPRQRQVENEKGRAKGRPDAPPAKAVLPPDSQQGQKPVQATEAPPPAARTDVSSPSSVPLRPALPNQDKTLHSPKQRQIENEKARGKGRTEPLPQVERSAEVTKPSPQQPVNNQAGDPGTQTPVQRPGRPEVTKPARSPRQAEMESQRPARETPPGKKGGAKGNKKTDEKKGEEQETPSQPPRAPGRPSQ